MNHPHTPKRLLAAIINPTYSSKKHLNGDYEFFFECEDGFVRSLFVPFESSGWLGVTGFQHCEFWDMDAGSHLRFKTSETKSTEWGISLMDLRQKVRSDFNHLLRQYWMQDANVDYSNFLIRWTATFAVYMDALQEGVEAGTRANVADVMLNQTTGISFWDVRRLADTAEDEVTGCLLKFRKGCDPTLEQFQIDVRPLIAALPVFPIVYRARKTWGWPDPRRRKYRSLCELRATVIDRFSTLLKLDGENAFLGKLKTMWGLHRQSRQQEKNISIRALKRAVKRSRISTAAARAWFEKQNLLSRFTGWAATNDTTKTHT